MKKKSYRLGAWMIAMLMIMSMIAGCSTKPSEPNKEAAKTTAPTQVKTDAKPEVKKEVKLSLLINKDHWTLGTQGIVDAFNAKGTGITVEVEVLPGGAETGNIMRTRLATGQAPDMMEWLSGALLNAVVPEKNFDDLSKEPFMANVDESFKTVMSLNGQTFGIPLTTSQFGVWFYNKKVYAELGLKPPSTWNELMANSQKIKNAGKTAILAPYKDPWTSQLIVLEDYYNVKKAVPTLAADLTANKIKLQNIPQYVRSWEKLQEVYTKEYVNKDALSMSYDMAIKALAEGTGAQFPMGSWVLDTLTEKYPDKVNDIGSFVQPSDDPNVNGITLWMPAGIMMSKKSKEKESVKKFLEFYVSKEGCEAYMSKQKPSGPFLIKGIALPDNVLPSVKDAVKYINSGASTAAMEFESPLKATGFDKLTVEVATKMMTPINGVKQTDIENEKFAKSEKLPGW